MGKEHIVKVKKLKGNSKRVEKGKGRRDKVECNS